MGALSHPPPPRGGYPCQAPLPRDQANAAQLAKEGAASIDRPADDVVIAERYLSYPSQDNTVEAAALRGGALHPSKSPCLHNNITTFRFRQLCRTQHRKAITPLVPPPLQARELGSRERWRLFVVMTTPSAPSCILKLTGFPRPPDTEY